jgi:ABC-2 type transport system permease protein
MKNILAITNKELRVYFTSPMAYVVIAMFLLVNGYLFYNIVMFAAEQGMRMMQFQQSLPQINVNEMIFRPIFHNMAIIMILTLPMLTMRLLAEEKKARTTELLMTSPVTLNQIILGKYLATVLVFASMLLLTGFMPAMMEYFADLKWVPVLTGYLGLLLLGGVFLSLGLLASSLTENQVIAGFVGFGLILLIWLLGWMAKADSGSAVSSVIGYLSVGEHFDSFVKGLIDTGDLIYLLSLITVGLFFTHRVLESQRWK